MTAMTEIVLDEDQLEAIQRCVDIGPRNRVVPITGEAGTGKTSIMQQCYTKLIEAGYTVALCAPTGKAAKRIEEATGIPAVTIHRLLEFPHPGQKDEITGKHLRTTEPRRTHWNSLEQDIILADEYAMVKWDVHRSLVDALKRGGCIRMFGDINQLPPIEQNKRLQNVASPFRDSLERFSGVVLKTNYRQQEGSGIIKNCLRVLKSKAPLRTDDFTLKITERPVAELRKHVLDDNAKYASLDSQIITPAVKTWVGTMKLNMMLQTILNPNAKKGSILPLDRHKWVKSVHRIHSLDIAIDDKVLWMENNYVLEIFNGEVGIVLDINFDVHSVTVDWGDRIVEIPCMLEVEDHNGKVITYNPQRSMDLAYAITTHKAQGSEYNNVCYVLNKATAYNQNRSNLYTAISRARQHVHIITDQKSLSLSVWKQYQGAR